MTDSVSAIGRRLGAFGQTAEYLGISFWVAWILLIYSGEFYFVTDDGHLHATLCYLVSTAFVSLAFLAGGLRSRWVSEIVSRRRVVVGGGIAAALGTLGTMFIGRPIGLFAALILSAMVTGLGTGLVGLRACVAMGRLSARNSFIVSAATLLQAFAIYLAVLSMPLPVGAAIVVALPVVAGLHVSLYQEREVSASCEEGSCVASRLLWRITLALLILAVVFSVSRGTYPNGIDISEFNDSRNFAAVGSMAFCIIMLALSVLLPPGVSFGQLGYWTIVVIVFVTTLFPVWGFDSAISGVASTVANSALGMTAWALFGAISSLSRMSPIRVYGLCFSAFMFGSAIGWPAGFVANIGMLGVGQYYLGLVLLLVVFVVVLTLFRQSDLAWITNTPEQDWEGDSMGTSDDVLVEKGAAAGLATDDDPREEAECGTRLGPGSAMDQRSSASVASQRVTGTTWKTRLTSLAVEHQLTEREIDVLLLLGKGMNARAVSDALGFSYNTSRVHVRNIYVKFNVHSRSELLDLIAENDRRLKDEEGNAPSSTL